MYLAAIFRDKRMKKITVKSYAKVNLTLEIVGTAGGYHLLDSCVASVDMYDQILLKTRKDKLSSVTMKGMGSESIPPEQNNALKAAEAFSAAFGTNGVDITVFKNIPMGAGLGGSSADVSGVLNGMAELYGVTDMEKLGWIADGLGSDTKYMLTGGFARMQGRGERITPLSIRTKLHMLLLCPNSSVSSGGCYKEYDNMHASGETPPQGATEKLIAALRQNNANEVGRYLMNDLYLPATKCNPDVQKAYEEALAFSPLGAVMTGSGSCVLALFETKELCDWAKSRYKGKFRAYTVSTIDPIASKKKKGWRNPFILSEVEQNICEE